MTRPLTTLVLSLGVLTVGCLDRPLDWNYRFEDESVRSETVMLRGEIWDVDDCADLPGLVPQPGELTPFNGTEFAVNGMGRGFDAPLEPGIWTFRVLARNASCEWIAAGCRTLELPDDEGELLVPLRRVTPQVHCDVCAPVGRCPDDRW